MSEYASGWQVSLKLLVWVAFVTLYWLGGRSHRWLRWLGGLVFAGGLIGVSLLFHTFHYRYLLSLVGMPLALSQGYGGETLPVKLRRRIRYGVGVGAVSLAFVTSWPLLVVAGLQLTMAVMGSVVLGVWNLLPSAPAEESAIASCSTVLVPMMG